jgi:hypothetical protein
VNPETVDLLVRIDLDTLMPGWRDGEVGFEPDGGKWRLENDQPLTVHQQDLIWRSTPDEWDRAGALQGSLARVEFEVATGLDCSDESGEA